MTPLGVVLAVLRQLGYVAEGPIRPVGRLFGRTVCATGAEGEIMLVVAGVVDLHDDEHTHIPTKRGKPAARPHDPSAIALLTVLSLTPRARAIALLLKPSSRKALSRHRAGRS